MAPAALFYQRIVPLSTEAHGELSLDVGVGFRFAAGIQFIPVTTPEFEKAAWHYPLVFVREGDATVPCAILGYRHGQNLFVTDDGRWDAEYVPAFARRYPFMLAAVEGRDAMTLCVDDTFAGLNVEDRGERLFLRGGGRSAFLERRLEFEQQLQAEQARSVQLATSLDALGVLEPVQAQVSLESGENLSLGGFSTVNRDRLRALEGTKLSELARDDWLELIYIHLFSLANFASLMDRYAARSDSATR